LCGRAWIRIKAKPSSFTSTASVCIVSQQTEHAIFLLWTNKKVRSLSHARKTQSSYCYHTIFTFRSRYAKLRACIFTKKQKATPNVNALTKLCGDFILPHHSGFVNIYWKHNKKLPCVSCLYFAKLKPSSFTRTASVCIVSQQTDHAIFLLWTNKKVRRLSHARKTHSSYCCDTSFDKSWECRNRACVFANKQKYIPTIRPYLLVSHDYFTIL